MKLQQIVDELALTLGRSVVVNDLDYRPIAASAQEDDIDATRARLLLKRETPADVREYLEPLKLRRLAQPLAISLSPFGGKERLAVPVRHGNETLAILWLITGDRPALTSADYAAIDAASALMGDLLESELMDDQRIGCDDLLSDDDAISRRAFDASIERRTMATGSASTVIAVQLLDDADTIGLRTSARRLGGLRAPALLVPGARGGALIVVAPAAHRAQATDVVCAELASAGIRIGAVGSAAIGDGDVRLRGAADRAILAAHIVSRTPGVSRGTDIAELGFWALLDGFTGDMGALGLFSPAAAALQGGDEIARETVETYLDAAGSVRAACDRLHIHRTTLYYRLDNLPEVVKAALDDGTARSALHLCLKLVRYQSPSGRRISTASEPSIAS